MPTEPTIICPSCRTEIKLEETLAAPLIEATRQQYEKQLSQQSAEFARREQSMKAREAELAREKESVDATIDEKLKQERAKLAADAAKREQAIQAREESKRHLLVS